MRNSISVLAYLIVVCATSFGSPPNVPLVPVPEPIPTPMPAADTPLLLSWDRVMVIDGDSPFLVLDSPRGYVRVQQQDGPIRIYGKFVDGGNQYEMREYKGKHISIIHPAATGKCELLIVPVGETDPTKVIRRSLDARSGVTPQPTPDPVNPDVPTPDPKLDNAPTPTDGVYILIVHETGQSVTSEQFAMMYGKEAREFLDKNTKDYRIYDQNVSPSEVHWKDALGRKRQSIPWIVVMANKKYVYEGPLPASIDALKKIYTENHLTFAVNTPTTKPVANIPEYRTGNQEVAQPRPFVQRYNSTQNTIVPTAGQHSIRYPDWGQSKEPIRTLVPNVLQRGIINNNCPT